MEARFILCPECQKKVHQVRVDKDFCFIDPCNIRFIKADDKKCEVYRVVGKILRCTKYLSWFEEELPRCFGRPNQSFIVNLHHVDGISNEGLLSFIHSSEHKIYVTDKYYDEFMHRLHLCHGRKLPEPPIAPLPPIPPENPQIPPSHPWDTALRCCNTRLFSTFVIGFFDTIVKQMCTEWSLISTQLLQACKSRLQINRSQWQINKCWLQACTSQSQVCKSSLLINKSWSQACKSLLLINKSWSQACKSSLLINKSWLQACKSQWLINKSRLQACKSRLLINTGSCS